MTGPTAPQDFLKAENTGLRLLLEQAAIDAEALLVQVGVDTRQRETADQLQKLILEELHHRIKHMLATVSAIVSQSLRTATDIEHGRQAIEGRLSALGRAHDLLLQAQWSSANLAHIVQGATEPYDGTGEAKFSIQGPDFRVSSDAVTVDPSHQWLHLTWTEKGGPAVEAPSQRSFGTRLIETLGKQLLGRSNWPMIRTALSTPSTSR
jgi:two-component sensor histidine kinase